MAFHADIEIAAARVEEDHASSIRRADGGRDAEVSATRSRASRIWARGFKKSDITEWTATRIRGQDHDEGGRLVRSSSVENDGVDPDARHTSARGQTNIAANVEFHSPARQQVAMTKSTGTGAKGKPLAQQQQGHRVADLAEEAEEQEQHEDDIYSSDADHDIIDTDTDEDEYDLIASARNTGRQLDEKKCDLDSWLLRIETQSILREQHQDGPFDQKRWRSEAGRCPAQWAARLRLPGHTTDTAADMRDRYANLDYNESSSFASEGAPSVRDEDEYYERDDYEEVPPRSDDDYSDLPHEREAAPLAHVFANNDAKAEQKAAHARRERGGEGAWRDRSWIAAAKEILEGEMTELLSELRRARGAAARELDRARRRRPKEESVEVAPCSASGGDAMEMLPVLVVPTRYLPSDADPLQIYQHECVTKLKNRRAGLSIEQSGGLQGAKIDTYLRKQRMMKEAWKKQAAVHCYQPDVAEEEDAQPPFAVRLAAATARAESKSILREIFNVSRTPRPMVVKAANKCGGEQGMGAEPNVVQHKWRRSKQRRTSEAKTPINKLAMQPITEYLLADA
eukprot:CAMPEP_0178985074 /NCGR_PEP_ID=MMETSP0795-20121207/1957_1 /TAXON_ID=88552 /ORGANISM="Amoebophrya sp., Strain Ameob2" /LENGTH=568 /DNA_ID=CAMNT_0020676005 /DNA_START=27 /DNA_END=1733 /DNA_ORIENTATION=+